MKKLFLLFSLIFLLSIFSFTNNVSKQNFFFDRNNNSYPDLLELNQKDSQLFIKWYKNVLLEIIDGNLNLPNNYNDCSGLVRYVYKESLKKHTQSWVKNNNYMGPIFEDISKYNYPNLPVIKEDIFKISKDIKKESFDNFADARHLMEFNCNYLGKKIRTTKNCDLAFFFHPEDYEFPYHTMIIIYSNNIPYAIYHTGPGEDNSGTLRLTKVSELYKAGPTWIMSQENDNFLGFYRFKILEN